MTSSLNSPVDLQARWAPYRLDFTFTARTSRETMRHKDTYFVRVADSEGLVGVGECALFKGLSTEDNPQYDSILRSACNDVAHSPAVSSVRFGFETALINGGWASRPDTPFTRGEVGIPINGLIWMGSKSEMRRRIDEKLAAGFNVLKLKIGGIDFESEVDLLRYIRSRYSASVLELRLDANGSFAPSVAMERLNRLSEFDIHSIEQPIKAGQPNFMAALCASSPIPIALDEELIGMPTPESATILLDVIRPQYIILKPALCGGFAAADMWIHQAVKRSIGWWATSALESNIGLQAIASWVSTYNLTLPQGLGTGQLYSNNIPSGLYLKGNMLYLNPEIKPQIPQLQWRL